MLSSTKTFPSEKFPRLHQHIAATEQTFDNPDRNIKENATGCTQPTLKKKNVKFSSQFSTYLNKTRGI
jgi:hypothetical protein